MESHLYEGRRPLRRLPRLLASAIELVWQAAPGLILLFGALQLVSALSTGLSLLAVRALVTALLGSDRGHVDPKAVLLPLAVLAALMTLVTFGNALRQGLTMLLQERITWLAFERVLDVSAAVDLEAFDHSDFHDRLQRAQTTGAVRPFQIVQSLMAVGASSTTLIGVLSVLFYLQPLLVPSLLVTVVPLVVATSAFSRDFYRFMARYSQDDRRRSYLRALLTTRDMAKEVRAFGLAGHLRVLNQRLFAERLRDMTSLVGQSSLRSVLGGLGAGAAVIGTVAVLLWFVVTGRMTLASATAAAVAISQVSNMLSSLAFGMGQLYESSLFLEDHRAFVEMLPRVGRRPHGTAPSTFETICVQGVTFSYPEADRPAIHDVSLTIRRGEVVALVGENGSGKTTLAKVLCQLYQPQVGRICWDGIDLATVNPDQLRGSIAVLFQDFARYLFDVADNVGLGRVERREDQVGIEEAARQAGADEFISGLPAGYSTMLGRDFDGGVDLSLGQWQRIALARAFFRDAPLVVLDEPTAALDARREHELFDSLRALLCGRTVVLISHRFSSVVSADRIYVLKAGRVVEQGSHAELMRANGHYAELFNLQASMYQSEP
jgi:ATP-binding cassette subfamily B protein